MVQIYRNEAVIFDLDDLLFKEFDFLRSAYWEIAQMIPGDPKKLFRLMMVQYFSGQRVLDWLYHDYCKGHCRYSLDYLITVYRTHHPDISLSSDALELLNNLKANKNPMGLITDGRSITQRNKMKALGLNNWISDFTISEELGYEKPAPQAYLYFMEKFNANNFVYLADNYNKDFKAPNELGWRTVVLTDNGLNIHGRRDNLDPIYSPQETIQSLKEVVVNEEDVIDVAN
jgi:putative hydrolase of the HAD superfamily